MHFGWILGGFWEAKIINFRIFSHVFWKQISNNVSEAQKIENKVELHGSYQILVLRSGGLMLLGREKERGPEAS